MRYVTATEARKHSFRLLDEAASGEVIAIRRDSKKLILKLEEEGTGSELRPADPRARFR